MLLTGNWVQENFLMIGPWPIISIEQIEKLDPFKVFINLTDTPYPLPDLKNQLIDVLQVPIKDYSIPSPEQVRTLIRHLFFYESCHLPVYMHCMGGLGRAGTTAALFLIAKGRTATLAIKEVRSARPGAIETKEQEIFLYSCEEWVPALTNAEDQLFFQAKKIIQVLREKCPWDKKQTHESLIASLMDESFEVVEAIRERNPEHLKEELGDLLIQPLIQSQIAEEEKNFTIYDSLQGMITKLIFRHPHVFQVTQNMNAHQVIDQWNSLKQIESNQPSNIVHPEQKNTIDLEPIISISKEASAYGFDWSTAEEIVLKMKEECDEIILALATEPSRKIEQELGDLLFASVHFARYYGLDITKAFARGRRKFEIRFRYVQRAIERDGKEAKKLSSQELDQYWNKAKEALPEAY